MLLVRVVGGIFRWIKSEALAGGSDPLDSVWSLYK